jgi:uncharacterized protein (TIRG00374 family)
MGGDVVRIYHLYKKGLDSHILISSTLLDRVFGLATIIIMGLIAIIYLSGQSLRQDILFPLLIISFVVPGIVIFLSSDYSYKLLTLISIRVKHNRLTDFLIKILKIFQEYRLQKAKLLIALFLSLLAQCLIILSYILIGGSLNIEISPWTYFAVVPLVFLASSIPVSIGGLGVRESVIVYLLVEYGANTQAAIAVSLLYFAVIVILTAPGGLILLSKNKKIELNARHRSNHSSQVFD